MPKLTKRVVDATKPGERELTIWDTEIPGFGLRVRASGVKTYMLKYRAASGAQRKITIGRAGALTVEQARAIARKWLAAVAAGGDPSAERKAARTAPTVAELAALFLEEHAKAHKRPRSCEADERNIENHLKPLLGSRKAAQVVTADIERMKRDIRDGKTALDVKTGPHGRRIVRGGPVIANRVLSLARTIYNMGGKWGLPKGHPNPCDGVKKYDEKRVERFLTTAELGRLGQALAAAEAAGTESPAAIAALRLLVLTGMRLSEVLTLEWSFVDFERAVLNLPTSKTGKKAVRIGAAALAVLGAIDRVEGNPFVIVGAKAEAHLVNLHEPWVRVRDAAELEGARLHDLRHSYASTGAAAGLSLPIIGELLGHKSTSTTQRYAHLGPDPVRAAVETVDSTIAAALAGDGGGEVVPIGRGRRL